MTVGHIETASQKWWPWDSGGSIWRLWKGYRHSQSVLSVREPFHSPEQQVRRWATGPPTKDTVTLKQRLWCGWLKPSQMEAVAEISRMQHLQSWGKEPDCAKGIHHSSRVIRTKPPGEQGTSKTASIQTQHPIPLPQGQCSPISRSCST